MERSIEKLVDLAKQEDQDAINELYNRTFKKVRMEIILHR